MFLNKFSRIYRSSAVVSFWTLVSRIFGYGRDILGDPMNAFSWIVSRRDIIGSFIPKGSIILLGSLVQTKWLSIGDSVEVNINDVGRVKVSFI